MLKIVYVPLADRNPIEGFVIDAELLDELREIEKAIAAEMGQLDSISAACRPKHLN